MARLLSLTDLFLFLSPSLVLYSSCPADHVNREEKKKRKENVSTWSMFVLHEKRKKENDEVHMYIDRYIYTHICKTVLERKANSIGHKPRGATSSFAGNVYIFSQTCERQTEA